MIITLAITCMFYAVAIMLIILVISLTIVLPIHFINKLIQKKRVKRNDTFCYKCCSFEPDKHIYNNIDSYSFVHSSKITYYCNKRCIYVHDTDNCNKFIAR